jgi:hypothetical protein
MNIDYPLLETPDEVKEWLVTPPEETEIEIVEGIKILRQRIIERKLDHLTSFNWSTSNFRSSRFQDNGQWFLEASLELHVYIPQFVTTRILVGAVTIPMTFFGDSEASHRATHSTNTAKSICISNAASELGEQFGRNLNLEIKPVISEKPLKKKREAVKMTPDAKINMSYDEALSRRDWLTCDKLEEMYSIGEDRLNDRKKVDW